MAVPVSTLPLKAIPGDYGLPYLGAVKDRLDYFWFQGELKFYKSRMEKYNSTVFRVNVPPGPTITKDAGVICLLDTQSFPALFDVSKCEKNNLFVGLWLPDVHFTGGLRVCAYLDPSEERHTKLKEWCFLLLQRNGRNFLPEFHKSIEESFVVWEAALAKGEKADVAAEVEQFAFNFLLRAVVHRDPVAPGIASLGRTGGPNAMAWLKAQLAPIGGDSGLPHVVEELMLRTVQFPPALFKSKYDAIYEFIKTYATESLDLAETMGIGRHDATANLVFFLSFNAFGGFSKFFRQLTGYIAKCGPGLMHELHDEVRTAVTATERQITLKSLENMPLLRSVVYESFRFDPPVPYQYAKAKTDFLIENHENSFQVKKGEFLYGFQSIVTHDPKVFANPDEFLPRRFMGPEGEKLIKYIFWSNGRETEKPTVHNKQCAGKELVVTMSRVYVAELFLRYKDFTLAKEGKKLFFSAVTKA